MIYMTQYKGTEETVVVVVVVAAAAAAVVVVENVSAVNIVVVIVSRVLPCSPPLLNRLGDLLQYF